MSQYIIEDHWELVDHIDWRDNWPNFSPKEMACSHCQSIKVNRDFMTRLQQVRTRYGMGMVISSGYRCPEHNAAVSATNSTTGPHTTGHAADTVLSHKNAYKFLMFAMDASSGMTGIGINQRGQGRFIHLDDLQEASGQPRPHVWSY